MAQCAQKITGNPAAWAPARLRLHRRQACRAARHQKVVNSILLLPGASFAWYSPSPFPSLRRPAPAGQAQAQPPCVSDRWESRKPASLAHPFAVLSLAGPFSRFLGSTLQLHLPRNLTQKSGAPLAPAGLGGWWGWFTRGGAPACLPQA